MFTKCAAELKMRAEAIQEAAMQAVRTRTTAVFHPSEGPRPEKAMRMSFK